MFPMLYVFYEMSANILQRYEQTSEIISSLLEYFTASAAYFLGFTVKIRINELFRLKDDRCIQNISALASHNPFFYTIFAVINKFLS